MTATLTQGFVVRFSEACQQLGYTSELKAATDLKVSDLVLGVDYIEPEDGETLFTNEGAIKFALIASTEEAEHIRQQLQSAPLALPEAIEIDGELIQPVPTIDPNIKFLVDRSAGLVWGKIDEHYFTVSFTGRSTFYYDAINWSYPESIVEDGQIKSEIVDYAMGLI